MNGALGLVPRGLRRRLHGLAVLVWITRSPSLPVAGRLRRGALCYDDDTYDRLEERWQELYPDPGRFGLTWTEVRPPDVAPGMWPWDHRVDQERQAGERG